MVHNTPASSVSQGNDLSVNHALLDQAIGATESSDASTHDLRARMFVGGIWIALGAAGSGVLRLMSSLVLTRLLLPEHFGLMATAGLLTIALEMFSDLGIRQALVQHPRGDSQRFLQTAFTLSVCRGIVLGLLCCAVARPFGAFFLDERLPTILLALAVVPVLRGLASPELLVFTRTLQFGRLERFEFACTALRIVLVIILAIIWRNVWALVIGAVLGVFLRTAGSFWITRYKPSLGFNPALAKDIFKFGRFIMISTILGYFAMQLDRAFVARYLGIAAAGQYYIAAMLAAVCVEAIHKATGRSLFSGLSRLQHNIEQLIAATIIPAMVVAAANGELLVVVLYDERYHQAGSSLMWLLAAGAVRVWGDVFNAPLIATGRPAAGTVAKAVSFVCTLIALPLLGSSFGMQGYAAGIFVSSLCGAAVTVSWTHCSGHVQLPDWAGSLVSAGVLGVALLACHVVGAVLFQGVVERCASVAVASGILVTIWLWRDRARWIRLVEKVLMPMRAAKTEVDVEP